MLGFTALLSSANSVFHLTFSEQYTKLLIDYKLNKSVEKQFEEFKKGFYEVCDRRLLVSSVLDINFYFLYEGPGHTKAFTG